MQHRAASMTTRDKLDPSWTGRIRISTRICYAFVAREASTAATSRLVFELKAQGHHEGKDTLEQGFAIMTQPHVGGFILEIDGDCPVFAGLASGVAHGSPSGAMVDADDDRMGVRPHSFQGITTGGGASPRKSLAWGNCPRKASAVA